MTLLVRDIDEAAAFYREAFGFEVLFEGDIAPGLRSIHAGPAGQEGVGLWFLPARGEESLGRIGRQTAGEPAMVLYVDDLETSVDNATRCGGQLVKEPIAGGDGFRFAHVTDRSGNEIVLVQPPPSGAQESGGYRVVGS